MQLPDIESFQESPAFFRAFLELNHPDISHRKLASRLKWPISLLGDVIQGRRTLPVSRAIEFARCFDMTAIQTERLVMFALKDSGNDDVGEFVDNYFRFEGKTRPAHGKNGAIPQEILVLPESWGFDRAATALLLFLEWTQGRTSEEEIGELLYLFPELKDRNTLQDKINEMRDLGLIEGELPHLRVKSGSRTVEKFRREHVLASLEPLKKLSEGFPNQTSWHYAQVLIPSHLYGELVQRMATLVNWLMNQSHSLPEAGADRRDCIPLQINFLITHLIDLHTAGLKMRVESYKDQSIERL